MFQFKGTLTLSAQIIHNYPQPSLIKMIIEVVFPATKVIPIHPLIKSLNNVTTS